MPHELLSTIKEVLTLIHNKEVMLSSGYMKRVLVYKCVYTNTVLKDIDRFYSDGTFKCCTAPFIQLYINLANSII